MNTSKIIKGVVSNGRYTVTAPIVKEDYGLYLQIDGVELPQTYEVDFSNSESSGTSVTMIGNSDGVLIPSQFIGSGKDVFAFLYHVGQDFGRTVYKFRIPNKVRPDRTDEEPTPEQASTIDQTISALNTAVAKTAQDVINADASAQRASEFAEDARDAEARAAARAATAKTHADRAEQASDDAQTYANNASASARASAQSASQAQASAQTAQDALEEFTTPTASATTLPEGSNATANYADGHFTFGIPTGATGAKGDKGDKGDTGIGEKGDKGDKGDTGERGTGMLRVTTAPTSYTTKIGDFTPKFRIALSTVELQAEVDKVLVGDVLIYSYNHYVVGYVDSSYVYLGAATSFRGAKGATGATGPAGSDANVTSANIESALGYVPVSPSSLNGSLNKLISKTSSQGYVLTYDSTVSESKPYPWSWASPNANISMLPITAGDSAGIYYVISQLKTAADSTGLASMSVPFDAGAAFLSNISATYSSDKMPIISISGTSPNPLMRYLMINNLWADSTDLSGAEMGYWDGLYHVEIVIGQSAITIIVEKKG